MFVFGDNYAVLNTKAWIYDWKYNSVIEVVGNNRKCEFVFQDNIFCGMHCDDTKHFWSKKEKKWKDIEEMKQTTLTFCSVKAQFFLFN